jgi:tripartite-type tricarboxylate transporter receptor subunit TctC
MTDRSTCMTRRARRITLIGLAALALPGAPALAQDFPARPIRIMVPWAPGGNVDITARTIAPALSEILGQQVVIENRPGAGGMIGSASVAKGAADGYTLLLGSSGTITVAPALARNPSYDPIKDFALVGPIHSVPIVLTASAKVPIRTYREFLAQAQTRPGQVSVASAGTGSSNHLAIELLGRQAGVKLNHIPYKGSGPALTDLVGGQVDAMMDQLTASLPHIKEGRIRALAVTSRQRSAQQPDVPTLIELGLPDYEVITFTGLFAPAGTPRPILDKLQAALRQALARPAVRERFAGLGVDLIEPDYRAFEAYVQRDFANWRAVAREAGITMD